MPTNEQVFKDCEEEAEAEAAYQEAHAHIEVVKREQSILGYEGEKYDLPKQYAGARGIDLQNFRAVMDKYGQLWITVYTDSAIKSVIVSSNKTDFGKAFKAHFKKIETRELIDEEVSA